MLKKFYNLGTTKLLLIVILTTIFFSWLSRTVLINDIVFFNTFSDRLTFERSTQLFENLEKLAWVNYVFVPIGLFLKFVLISVVLYTGIFLNNLHENIRFSLIFRVVVASEIVFVFAAIIKIFWFYFFAGNYDLDDLSFFYPLSLINLFSRTEVSTMWIYPLQIVSLFQVMYIILLSYGLKSHAGLTEFKSDSIVLSSYIPAMAVWTTLIIFISIDAV
jgi:hypothetical protein